MLGPYAAYILTSYLLALVVVLVLIGWIAADYRSQTKRLRQLEQSGIGRRSGRSATEMP